jgi:hypothetical protein
VLDRAIGRVITDAGMVEFPLAPDVSPTVVRDASSSPRIAERADPAYEPAMEERRRRHSPETPPAGASVSE